MIKRKLFNWPKLLSEPMIKAFWILISIRCFFNREPITVNRDTACVVANVCMPGNNQLSLASLTLKAEN